MLVDANLGINEERSRKHVARMLREIKKAHQAGKRYYANQVTNEYLCSFDARYVAVVDASRKMKWSKRPHKAKLLSIAEGLNVRKGTNELVRVHFKKKEGPNEDYRPMLDFGIEHRAFQHLLLKVLRVRAQLHENQFFTRGGVPAAVQKVVSELKAGNIHCIETDISACYSSFNADAIPDFIPLPKEVTRRIITSTYYNLIPGNFINDLGEDAWSKTSEVPAGVYDQYISAARSGLPQGSVVSPLVSEMLLASVVADLNTSGCAPAYADNILAMAKDATDAAEMSLALRCALKSHPAGPLMPSWVTEPVVYEPFTFVGYRIHQNNSGEVSVSPSGENLQKFHSKFHRIRKSIEFSSWSPCAKKALVAELTSYVKGWTSAFSLWPNAQGFRAKHLAKIAHLKSALELEGSG